MGVYSSIDVYPEDADLPFDCEQLFCETCTFDCQEDKNWIINTIFEDEKGYYSVNNDAWFLHDVFHPCITMYSSEAPKFQRNMKKFGFNTIIVKHRCTNYLCHIFIIKQNQVVDPTNIIPIFRKLDVIK